VGKHRRMKCRHCRYVRNTIGRGLCERCHAVPGVKERYTPLPHPKRSNPPSEDSYTVEQVEACVAEQLQRLPRWWAAEAERGLAVSGSLTDTRARDYYERVRTRFVMPRKWRTMR
jgi:hypothetical protein